MDEIPEEEGLIAVNGFIPRLIPISRQTWWTWVKAGTAPKPIKFGPHKTSPTFWKKKDIVDFINGKWEGGK